MQLLNGAQPQVTIGFLVFRAGVLTLKLHTQHEHEQRCLPVEWRLGRRSLKELTNRNDWKVLENQIHLF